MLSKLKDWWKAHKERVRLKRHGTRLDHLRSLLADEGK